MQGNLTTTAQTVEQLKAIGGGGRIEVEDSVIMMSPSPSSKSWYSLADMDSMNRITKIMGEIKLQDVNTLSGAFTMATLTDVRGQVSIVRCKFKSIVFESFKHIGENILIDTNQFLKSVSFPNLVSVGFTFVITDNSALTSITFPSIKNIGMAGSGGNPGSYLHIFNNGETKTVTSPSCTNLKQACEGSPKCKQATNGVMGAPTNLVANCD